MNSPENPGLAALVDAARRVSDTCGMHWTADTDGARGKWCAFALADGRSDNNLYDTREQAARHQLAPELYLYLQLVDVPTVKEAARLLEINRQIYDNGYRTDPETVIVPGDGGNILIPLELEKWSQSGLKTPRWMRRLQQRQQRRNRP